MGGEANDYSEAMPDESKQAIENPEYERSKKYRGMKTSEIAGFPSFGLPQNLESSLLAAHYHL